jgi:hypothetical protein
MTSDEQLAALCEKRKDIQLIAENTDEDTAAECWTRLGVANRHIERIFNGILPLTPGVLHEIEACFYRVETWLNSKKSQAGMGKSGMLGDL